MVTTDEGTQAAIYGNLIPLMACDPSRAYATGLTPRPLAETVLDTLAWTRTVDPAEGIGITPETEADLLARARAVGA